MLACSPIEIGRLKCDPHPNPLPQKWGQNLGCAWFIHIYTSLEARHSPGKLFVAFVTWQDCDQIVLCRFNDGDLYDVTDFERVRLLNMHHTINFWRVCP